MFGVEICLFLVIVILVTHSNCNKYESEFHNFIAKFRKPYTNTSYEYHKRLHAFQTNFKTGQELNNNRSDNNSAWFGINKFSDFTDKEFKDVYLSDYIPAKLPLFSAQSGDNLLKTGNGWKSHILSSLPLHVDWREKGHVTAVKNQGSCGGCWAFSSIELMESQYAAQTGHLQEFSIQEILDCSHATITPYGPLKGCEGGQLCAALYWLNKTQTTVVPESKYKLKDKDQFCKIIPKSEAGIKLQGYECYNFVHHESHILAHIALHGPVAVAVDGSNWHNYLGGIVQYHCPAKLNHAVVIVGYDLTGPVPYYIVRNSWGTDWGIDGYIHVKYGHNLCGIALEVTLVTKVHVV